MAAVEATKMVQRKPVRCLNVPKQKASLLAADEEPKKKLQMLSKSRKVEEAEEAEPESLLREKLVAEFVGTFFLVLTVGVSVVSGSRLAPIAIGGVLGVQIYTFASVSGGVFNPAVTLAILLSGRGKLSMKDAGLYALVQFIAGICGGLVAYFITDMTFAFDWTAATPLGGGGTSFVLEAIFTMALCNIVLSAGTSYDAPNQYFGAAIGGSVTFAAFALGPWDQGSLNPAVTLGINLARLAQEDGPSADKWLVFLLAPLLGGLLAAGVFRLTRKMEFDADETNDSQHFLYEKVVAEFVGTFMLVLTVCLAVTGASWLAAVAIGGMLAVQIYTFGSVSGGLFNPAVTLAVFLSRRDKLDVKCVGPYLLAQFIGGIIGAVVAWACTDTTFAFDFSNNSNAPGWASAAWLEVLFTSVLCSIVLSAGTSFDAPNQYFGFAIGGAVMAAASGLGRFDQGSLNPAVTLGVNLANVFNDERTQEASAGDGWLLFLIAPFIGGALSAGIFMATRSQEYDGFASKKSAKEEPAAAAPAPAATNEAEAPAAAAVAPAAADTAAAGSSSAAEQSTPAPNSSAVDKDDAGMAV